MKRHVTYELEPADLEAIVEGHPLDLDGEDADSVSISTDAHPMPLGQAGGFRFVDKDRPVADGGLKKSDPFELVLETLGDERGAGEWVARVSGAPAYGDHTASTPGDALRRLAEQFDTVVDESCEATDDGIADALEVHGGESA